MFKDRNDYHGEKEGEQCLWMVDLAKKDAFWVTGRKRVECTIATEIIRQFFACTQDPVAISLLYQ